MLTNHYLHYKADRPMEDWHRAKSGETLRNFVLGTSDGLITVMCFVAGIAATQQSNKGILLAGFAEMMAGSIAMGLGAFMGCRAERDLYQRERQREEKEILLVPEIEKEEIRVIYRAKGFSGADLERIVEVITADPKRWVDIMMLEELGLQPPTGAAWVQGLTVGLSYVIAAAVPLISYVFLPLHAAFIGSLIITGVALLGLGAAKSYYTQRAWYKGALESLLMGVIGTLICYGIGRAVSAYSGGHTP